MLTHSYKLSFRKLKQNWNKIGEVLYAHAFEIK